MALNGRKEAISVRIDKELCKRLEALRKQEHTTVLLSRSFVYNETLFYGEKIQQIRKEVGDREFTRIWNLLNKLDLTKVNLEKII
jgi:hypothetical protein